jgi:hypothetical protein
LAMHDESHFRTKIMHYTQQHQRVWSFRYRFKMRYGSRVIFTLLPFCCVHPILMTKPYSLYMHPLKSLAYNVPLTGLFSISGRSSFSLLPTAGQQPESHSDSTDSDSDSGSDSDSVLVLVSVPVSDLLKSVASRSFSSFDAMISWEGINQIITRQLESALHDSFETYKRISRMLSSKYLQYV